ncbi:MAG: hypothetical protein NTW08_00430 [Gammaproteobacteria bacterium]|nr:hypothetical protein [Gammaproteobacteria bacterium]
MKDDNTLENLLDLDGIKMVIDEKLGLWVKFEVSITSLSVRSNGIRYSLSLHDQYGRRIIGFDNAHEVEYGAKRLVSPKRIFDHWHVDEHDKGQPYHYVNAGKLVEDFWVGVEKRLTLLKENEK